MSNAWPDIDTVLAVHSRQIHMNGGIQGVRSISALAACIEAPYAGFGGQEFYPTIEEKAARLAYEIITQHPFLDGNKRTGLNVMLAYYKVETGNYLAVSDQELVEIGYQVADGTKKYPDLLEFIREHKPIQNRHTS